MAVAFVRATSGGTNASSTSIPTSAFGSNTTTGNAILVAAAFASPTITVTSVTDTAGNTYSPVATIYRSSSTNALQIWAALNIIGGSSQVVTANLSASAGFRRIIAFEVSGIATSSAFDQHAETEDTSAAPSVGPVTTTTDGQFVVAAFFNEGSGTHNFSAGSGFTEPANATASANDFEVMCEYLIQPTAGSISATAVKSGASDNLMAMATFKAADGGTPPTSGQQIIDIGDVINDGTGDPVRVAFDKCNDNFTELYAADTTFLTAAVAAATYQPLDATLIALAAYNTNGLITQTAAETFTGRTLTGPAAGITVTNGDGVAGNPTLALADDLAALEALSGTNNIYYRSGTSTWSAVTIGSNMTFAGGTLNSTGGGGGFNTVNVQKFVASGTTTYTPTAGMKFCTIELVGGGGGGGGITGTTNNTCGGAGGGSGGYSRRTVSAATIGASQNVTVGIGGTAGTGAGGTYGGTGGSGGQTFVGATFATAICAANGGTGGGGGSTTFYYGGLGGTVTGAVGDITITGNSGEGCLSISADVGAGKSANGAPSFFGGLGRGAVTASGTSAVGGVGTSGGGGGGGYTQNDEAFTPRAGGAGGVGLVIITEFI